MLKIYLFIPNYSAVYSVFLKPCQNLQLFAFYMKWGQQKVLVFIFIQMIKNMTCFKHQAIEVNGLE